VSIQAPPPSASGDPARGIAVTLLTHTVTLFPNTTRTVGGGAAREALVVADQRVDGVAAAVVIRGAELALVAEALRAQHEDRGGGIAWGVVQEELQLALRNEEEAVDGLACPEEDLPGRQLPLHEHLVHQGEHQGLAVV